MNLRFLLLFSLATFSFAQPYTLTLTGNATVSGTNTGDQSIPSSGGTADANEDRIYAVAVTAMRPSKLKWKVGNFGTFTPTERIYARIVNLCRMGSDTGNYTSGLFNRAHPLDAMPVPSGASITAHGSFSVLCYVTETDVAAVSNAKRTWTKMLAYLMRDATITHYQAHATGAKGSTPPSGQTNPTTITPGTYGSIVLEMEGQGYECDLNGTVSSTSYVTTSLAPKNAITTGGVNNDWGHVWWGRVPVLMPIAGTMDSQTFAWDLKVYTAQSTYDGFANARVAALPSDWDTDAP